MYEPYRSVPVLASGINWKLPQNVTGLGLKFAMVAGLFWLSGVGNGHGLGPCDDGEFRVWTAVGADVDPASRWFEQPTEYRTERGPGLKLVIDYPFNRLGNALLGFAFEHWLGKGENNLATAHYTTKYIALREGRSLILVDTPEPWAQADSALPILKSNRDMKLVAGGELELEVKWDPKAKRIAAIRVAKMTTDMDMGSLPLLGVVSENGTHRELMMRLRADLLDAVNHVQGDVPKFEETAL